MNTDQTIHSNPFSGSHTKVTRVFDENKQSFEYMKSYIEKNEIEAENEFYVLFTNGTLCKKGRSGIKTSDYLNNTNNSLKQIKDSYENI